jgi:hypothetical protein
MDGLLAVTDKLARAAEDDGDNNTAWELSKIGMAYRDAAYQAGRMRVDQVTLDLISKPVSEMYTRQNRMELETVTVRPDGLRMLREFNKATVTARTKHAATKAAAVPTSMSDGDPVLTRRVKKSLAAVARKKEDEQKRPQTPKAAKTNPGAASSAADTTGRGQPAGSQ